MTFDGEYILLVAEARARSVLRVHVVRHSTSIFDLLATAHMQPPLRTTTLVQLIK